MDKRIADLKKAMELDEEYIENAIKTVLEKLKAFDALETEITIKKTGDKIELSIDDIQGDLGLIDLIKILTQTLAAVLRDNIEDSDELETAIDIVTDMLRDGLL